MSSDRIVCSVVSFAQNAIPLSSLHNYVANIRHGKHQFGPRDREGLNQFGGRCLAPNSSMISARVHAGLAYYLRRIGRYAVPLSPLIETIVCRSAVDPWSGIRSSPAPSLFRPRAPTSHVRVAIRRCTRSAYYVFSSPHSGWSMISMKHTPAPLISALSRSPRARARAKKGWKSAVQSTSYKLYNKHEQSICGNARRKTDTNVNFDPPRLYYRAASFTF